MASDARMLTKFLAYQTGLPSLPAVALRILELSEDPEAGIAELAAAITPDPALSAKLLRAANSPLYAQRRQVSNLRQVCSMLGLNGVVTVALTFSLAPADSAGPLDKTAYWRRSLVAAIACRSLAEALGEGDPERFFLAALLQDLGMVVLDKACPDEYAKILSKASRHDDIAAGETNLMGFDHAQLGGRLLRIWRVPEELCHAAEASHGPQPDAVPAGEASLMDRCVRVSGPLADLWVDEGDIQVAFPAVASLLQCSLGLGVRECHAVLDGMAALFPEYSSLFEVDLVDQSASAALLESARELSVLRNLKMLQETERYRTRNERLESDNRALARLTHLDPLTGVLNRGRLDTLLETEFQAARRNGWPLSVAFLDVDHFKRVNDALGHHTGDKVLTWLAKLLQTKVRTSDFVGRYGGEEFVLILPGTGPEDAYALVERIRKTTEAESLCNAGAHITVSLGVASYLQSHNTMAYDSASKLLRAADRALYAAKQRGRNQAIAYEATVS